MMTYHYIPVRMAKINNTDKPSANKNTEQLESSHVAGRNAREYHQLGEQLSGFLLS